MRAVTATSLVIAVLFATTALASASTAPNRATDRPPNSSLVVRTYDGAVQGRTTSTANEYLGIPYAAPPVGALRWHAPEPVAHWRGVQDATAYGSHCAQPSSAFGEAGTSEACLNLNVFTPTSRTAAAHRPLPVMVWINGGANIVGESDDYDPTPLVHRGVIVVTINYRLGALGYLADRALAGTDGAAGNYGLMDQQAALRWVQHNIGRFGGDPRKVTLFGESAGGLSVLAQLASPAAKGLFSKAVIESGGYGLDTTPLAAAETAGQAFATTAGCTGAARAETASCLRNLPVSTILDDQNPSGYQPDIDGQVLPRSIRTALASGQFNRVPVINGSNRDERRLFVAEAELEGHPVVTVADYQGMIEAELKVTPQTAAIIATQYPPSDYPNPAEALSAAWTDDSFACPALTIDQSMAAYVPTYAYEFNDENAPERYLPPVSFPYGAAHESEVQYLFTLANTANPGIFTPRQQDLAATMQQDWTGFAHQGHPHASDQTPWPRFTSAHPSLLSLNAPGPDLETNVAGEHHCVFWSSAN
ncbi:carboxylesterase/lipase family protein [Streptacidiphilus sp. PAMC 29251]